MLTRKTQYAWMAMGGLICLFGLVLACKLRDGNKAVAQTDKAPALPGIEESAPPPLVSPPALLDKPAINSIDSLPIPKLMPPKSDFKSPQELNGPPLSKPVLGVPSLSDAPPPPYNPVLPASFSPNAPAPMKDDKPQTAPKSADLSFVPPPPPPMDKTSKPKSTGWNEPVRIPSDKKSEQFAPYVPYTGSGLKHPTAPPPMPSASTPPPMPSASTEPKVAPVSYAPVSAAAPSVSHGDREANPLPGEPPLAPAPGPVQAYHVRGTETLRDIARRTLGGSERVGDLLKLNPTLTADSPLHSGSTVRLPVDACVQAEESEPVKPLPVLRAKPTPPKAKVLPLTGTYQCSLDEKNQLTLPRALRDQFAGSETVLVSPGPDKCLWLTNHPHLERLAERLDRSGASEADVRVFKRLYFAQTEKVPVNADGRVAVPDRLAQFAGLHQELVLVGIDDHFEVWDAARWRQYTQQKSAAVTRSTTIAEQD